jgi:hypothetical protein
VAEKISNIDLEKVVTVGETATTLKQLAVLVNFGPTSSYERDLLLKNTQPCVYILDYALIEKLDGETTSWANIPFLGPFENFVKEQFLLSFLSGYALELHRDCLGKAYILPLSHTIAAICLYLLMPSLGTPPPRGASSCWPYYGAEEEESEITGNYRSIRRT